VSYRKLAVAVAIIHTVGARFARTAKFSRKSRRQNTMQKSFEAAPARSGTAERAT